MSRYFTLQCKRFLRLLPWAFLTSALLLGAIAAAYTLTTRQESDPENSRKISVALCGSTENTILELGLQALETFDSIHLSISFLQLSEEAAGKALDAGQIDAYIVIPETFFEEAFRGNILPLEMVTAPDAPGIISIFREEVAQTVTTLLLDAQKGVFGMIRYFEDHPVENRQSLINRLTLEYVELVFARNDAYIAQTLPPSGQPTMPQSLLGGFATLFLLLICLPFVPLLIRRNESFTQLLRSKGHRGISLSLTDFSVFLLVLAALVSVLCLGAGLVFDPFHALFRNVLPLLSVVVMVAAFSFFLGSLCSDLISGVLTQFFATAAMGFVCGCMYPLGFFPEPLQRLGAALPAGLARSVLTDLFIGRTPGAHSLWLWGYSAMFLILGCILRSPIPGRVRR